LDRGKDSVKKKLGVPDYKKNKEILWPCRGPQLCNLRIMIKKRRRGETRRKTNAALPVKETGAGRIQSGKNGDQTLMLPRGLGVKRAKNREKEWGTGDKIPITENQMGGAEGRQRNHGAND